MEYCDGGSLHKLLTHINLKEGQISLICKGVRNFLIFVPKDSIDGNRSWAALHICILGTEFIEISNQITSCWTWMGMSN